MQLRSTALLGHAVCWHPEEPVPGSCGQLGLVAAGTGLEMLEMWLGSRGLLGVSLEPAVKVEAVSKLGRRRRTPA